MSYEIIKNIRVRDGKVFIVGSSNNIVPKDYSEWECHSLSKILQNGGKDALEVEILKAYECGNFQGRSVRKYVNALERLYYDKRFCDEYKKYNWRNDYSYDSKEYNEVKENRNSVEFNEFLLKVLKAKSPRGWYVIYSTRHNRYFYYRRGSSSGYWSSIKGTKFKYYEQAVNLKNDFTNTEDWIIKKVN